MSRLTRWLFGSGACPGCGTPYEAWTDIAVERGYRIERKWWGCPLYRDAKTLAETARHNARWTMGKRTPLTEKGSG